MSESANERSRFAEAALWDDSADERERLGAERERLADEREQLADERERLADQDERAADRWISADDDQAASAREHLLRAEARVQRALAEQERARAAFERASLHHERNLAAGERETAVTAASGLEADELTWAFERRAFVATERARLADVRAAGADDRDELAARREHEDDTRERAARRREELSAQRDADATGAAARLDRSTDRARRDLAVVRDAGRRQRVAAVETRRRATSDRAEAERRRREAGAGPEPFGGFLLAQFTALTRELFASPDLFAVAERVADLTLECIPGAVAAGVTFFEGVRPVAHVTTDDIAEQLDAYQLARDEGPIGESLERGGPVTIGVLANDERWPSLRAMADTLGVRGVAACGLTVRRGQRWQPLGALTLYADRPGVFDDDTGDELSLFAAHMALVAAFDRDRHDVSRREAALHRALGSRDIIGQAKGILMERQHIPAGDAFDTLRRTSQRLNIRLQELATRLTETGDLPE